MQGPVERGCVVRHVEDHWMRIVCNGSRRHYMPDGAVIKDHCHEFKYVDGDECIIGIILHMEQRPLLHLLREVEVPPKAQRNGISSRTMQTSVTKCCSEGVAWYY